MHTRVFSELTKSDVSIAGGKGASLGEMTQAGIPVPPGFVILAEAFENMTDELAEEILARFDELGAERVAVRSSATVEDGAAASWAGQLETYLHVERAGLLDRVKDCWLSISSEHAKAYRTLQKLEDEPIQVAVVVQAMVESDVSGVAFSAHPVTHDRGQIVIEAGFGLGEALVSGVVTPDLYVVNKSDSRILETYVSPQDRLMGRGGWTDVPLEKRIAQKLANDQIIELSRLVTQIENHYGFPCDIEWALSSGRFFILQSRPITTMK